MSPDARLLGLLWASLADLGATVHRKPLDALTPHEVAAETALARERLRVLHSPEAAYWIRPAMWRRARDRTEAAA
ncbi:MAG: hypothetical protein L0206_16820 [Actinobacteria bacterium]|nr:hypothetical protein [Actinomycetota bacterium]